MFRRNRQESGVSRGLGMLELIFHAAVRSIRKTHGNAILGLFMNIAQTLLLVVVFYVMFAVLGMRNAALRGDYLLYIMSGIFLFMCHVKAMSAVIGSEGPASPMMKHAPMNTIIAISSAALGALYIQVLSLFVVLFIYHVAWTPVTVDQPVAAFSMLLLAWFAGVSIGMVFLALKPWFPNFVQIASQAYMRANMIASGKMFVANSLPAFMLPFFDWNPLFHAIDQARGFTFINYNPHFTSVSFAVYVSLVCLLIGLMGEFYTRQRASISWAARR
ncbi:ABC transporter permease [Rhodobacteraceae bacterium WD3A24]|nr:ABC transporter permease [Rhodobacteraceae bacterium WD3A24]